MFQKEMFQRKAHKEIFQIMKNRERNVSKKGSQGYVSDYEKLIEKCFNERLTKKFLK